MGDERVLRWTTAAFVAGSLVHAADHARRGLDAAPAAVQVLGYSGFVVTGLIAIAVFRRHPLAPVVAASGGATLVLGFLAVHWLPEWGPVSDTLVTSEADWRSRAASVIEIVTAAAMVAAAWRCLRAEQVHPRSDTG